MTHKQWFNNVLSFTSGTRRRSQNKLHCGEQPYVQIDTNGNNLPYGNHGKESVIEKSTEIYFIEN